MKKPKISVILGTYNGERFLWQQLASLAEQTLLPHELVIHDDASTDATVDIIERFSAQAPFLVRLTRHQRNRGVYENYTLAFRDASGDYIAPCDQDDTWDSDKLEVLIETLEDGPELAGAVGDARCIDASGSPLPGTAWERLRLTKSEQQLMTTGQDCSPLLRGNVVSGCRLVFRRRFRDLLLPLSSESFPDYWMAILLQAAGGLAFVDRSLQSYRIHNNLLGLTVESSALRNKLTNWRAENARYYRFSSGVLERLREHGQVIEPHTQVLLQQWSDFAKFRAMLPRSAPRRFTAVMGAIAKSKYCRAQRTRVPSWRYSSTLAGILMDNPLYRRGTINWILDLILG
jgi:glycosyltransferase involved in cell wall biosynthesis